MIEPVYNAHGITLYHGEAEDVLRQLHAAGEKFHALITDSPYCSGGTTARERTGKTAKKKYVLNGTDLERADFGGDQRDQRSFGLWAQFWLHLALRMMKPPAYCAAFIDRRNVATLIDAVQVAGWRYTDLLPWDKSEGGCRPCKGWFRSSQAEYAVVGLLGSLGREQDREGECLPGVLRGNRTAEEKALHMHTKPVSMMKTLMKPMTWLHPKGKARGLDLFVGSGSTLVAARELGLQFVGVEREAENVEITLKRLREVML